jgi:hypothetical protein
MYQGHPRSCRFTCAARFIYCGRFDGGIIRIRNLVMIAMGTLVACGLVIHGQGPSPEAQLVNRAADALGGRDRILAVKSLQLIGYGELAYFNGGSNITGSPDAPQKWQDINDYHRTIDLVNKRMRTEQRLKYNFVFANAAPQLGTNRTNQVVDLEAGARNARLDALTHPVLAVRTALDPATKLANMRRQGAEQLIDMTVKQGDTVTLRFDSASGLPSSISYVVGNGNLGDLTLTTKWVGWIPESGVLVPMGYNTTSDWRNIVQSKFYVDRNIVDGAIDAIVAPAAGGRGAGGGGAGGGGGRGAAQPPQPFKVADHVWYLNGNTFFEFDDHITMFEPNRADAALDGVLAAANNLVPGKQVTQVIASHHHFDHTAGLRAAVAKGLTIISRRGNEGVFREMVSRPAKQFPDNQGRNPQPLKLIPVDDHLKLKDNTNEVDIYHVIANNHMADGLMAHVPASSILVEADLTTQDWDYQWWGGSYMDNIEYRNIKVVTNLAVHAPQPFPIAEVLTAIEKQVRGAMEMCARAAAAQFFQPGCPVQYTRPLSPAPAK